MHNNVLLYLSMSEKLTPEQINDVFAHLIPDETTIEQAMAMHEVLWDAGFRSVVTVASEPFDISYGRRVMGEMLEPAAATRNAGTVIGPMVLSVSECEVKWYRYGIALYSR
jgi:hypothetical protein